MELRKSRFLSLVMVIALLAAFIPVPAVAADAAAVEKVTVKAYSGLAATATPIDPTTKQVGETLAVWVEAVNATQLQGMDFYLEYSKDTLEVDKTTDAFGNEVNLIALGDIKDVPADSGTLDATAGTISVGVANQSAADYTKAVLLKVQFKVKAEGSSYVRIRAGSLQLTGSGGALITPGSVEDLAFTIGTPPAPQLAQLVLSGTVPGDFKVGDTFNLSSLTLTATDQNGDPYDLTGKTVTWASSNAAVATVSGSTLTAVGAGTTQVTATVEDVTSNALTFTAETPPVGGSVEKITVKAYEGLAATATPIDPATKQVGETLAVWVEAVNATQLQGMDFYLEYSKDTLEVDKTTDAFGNEVNLIALGDIKDVPADSGTLDATAGTISVGVANQSAADYTKAVLLKVQFKVKAEGSSYVRIRAGSLQLTGSGGALITPGSVEDLAFTIGTPPAPQLAQLVLSGTVPGDFKVGDTFNLSSLTLTATDQNGDPYDLTGKTVTWASSNAAVATVSGSTLTAVGAGTTQVTATVEDVTSNALTFTVTAPVSWPVEVSDVRTLDQDGNPVSNFAPGDLYQVELTMTNVSEQTLTPMAIVRIERSDLPGAPQYTGTAKVTLQSNSTATVTIGPALPVDAATGTYKAKVMVWSNWLSQGGEPLAPAGEVTFTVGQ